MTNAPGDLLSLRSQIMNLTGLSAVNVGIVGDEAHAATGGYHEGKDSLINAGVWNTDYSVRLTRDRNGATNSASAMDIGKWGDGSAWRRFNGLLVDALHTGDSTLNAIRAVNYLDANGAKKRTDREYGWSVVSSSDSVDIHTHIEWYRDTEGTASRSASIGRIEALIQQAITGIAPAAKVAVRMEERMINGVMPNGFGIDENDGWIGSDAASIAASQLKTVSIPLPVVGSPSAVPGGWGPAWIYAAADLTCILRVGAYGAAGGPTWFDMKPGFLSPVGPIAIPGGTTSLLIVRKRLSATDTADSTPATWLVAYGS